jgi:hypothetical protein
MQLYTNKELKINKQCDTDDVLLKGNKLKIFSCFNNINCGQNTYGTKKTVVAFVT